MEETTQKRFAEFASQTLLAFILLKTGETTEETNLQNFPAYPTPAFGRALIRAEDGGANLQPDEEDALRTILIAEVYPFLPSDTARQDLISWANIPGAEEFPNDDPGTRAARLQEGARAARELLASRGRWEEEEPPLSYFWTG